MFKIFSKLYILLLIAVAVFVLGIANLDTLLSGTMEEHLGNLSKGTLHLIENALRETPPREWEALIEKLNQGGGYKMRLQKADDLLIPKADMQRLFKGEVTTARVINALHAYKQVGDEGLILDFPFEQSEYEHNQRLANSTFNLIERELANQSADGWLQAAYVLGESFDFPVTLVDLDAPKLSDDMTLDLREGRPVWEKLDSDTDYIYRRVGDTTKVLRLGPFGKPTTLRYLNPILLACLASTMAAAVFLWVFPLWRDLNKLDGSAQAFGRGEFQTRAKLPKLSPLYRSSEAFNDMAERIQKLITSHKELTNAVSHELRTPLARLRFGIEMLRASKDEADRQRFTESMEADIDELDALVAELLTYARFDRDRPEMKFQRQNIEVWLEEITDKARVGLEPGVALVCRTKTGEAEKYAQFEPRLMARATGNLLQNATRYAKSKVEATVEKQGNNWLITVEDDGPGVPEDKREKILEAFTRLDASRDRETGGFGLGLAIADRIAKWHGGGIKVNDSSLGGARFVISWPG